MPLDYAYVMSILVFLVVLAAIMYRDRSKIERKFGVLFMRRTKRGRDLVDRITQTSPTFWRLMGDVGIVAGFGGMVFGLWFLIQKALTPKTGPGLSFIIPLPSAEATQGFGYVGIPFWYFIVSIALLVIVHEGFHAIQVRREGVRIKSMGLALFAILPGAFVEPDERALRKKSLWSQMRVYAAGSFGNFILGGAVALLFLFAFLPAFYAPAFGFSAYVNPEAYGLTEPFPAEINELLPPIISVDGLEVLTREQFAEIMATKRPGDQIAIETKSGTKTITLTADPQNPDRAFLGIAGPKTMSLFEANLLQTAYRTDSVRAALLGFLHGIMAWLIALNIGVGLVNMFPIKPLDGGLLMEAVAKRFAPSRVDDVMKASSVFVLLLILWNFFGGFIV